MSTVAIAQQPLLIGGEWTAAQDGATFQRSDPFTGQPATEAAAGGRVDARRAVDAAQAAFAEWSRTPPGRRRALLWGAADLLTERAPDLAGVQVGMRVGKDVLDLVAGDAGRRPASSPRSG